MNLSIVNCIDENAWREFVERHPQGNIFHTHEMYRVFERARGYYPLLNAAIGADGEILALLPLALVSLTDGWLNRLTTRAIAYGGCLGMPGSKGEEALTRLLQEYSKQASRASLFTELRNLSDTTGLQAVLRSSGFAYEEHLNYLIDLDGTPEQLLQNIGSRTRKHIRQGLKRGKVVIEEIHDRSQITSWYLILRKTYTMAHVPLADRSLFDAAFEVLVPKGMAKFLLARIDQNYAAASIELLYKDVIYGWYGGMDRAYAKDTPGEMLMWYILKWGAENGYKTYDFGGAGIPGEEYGVRDFKAKFGGQLVCFGRNKKVHSPYLLGLGEWGYRIYRQFYKYLPVQKMKNNTKDEELS